MKTFQTYGNRKDQALTAFDSDNKGELFYTIRCNPISGYIVQKSANGPISVPRHAVNEIKIYLQNRGWTET